MGGGVDSRPRRLENPADSVGKSESREIIGMNPVFSTYEAEQFADQNELGTAGDVLRVVTDAHRLSATLNQGVGFPYDDVAPAGFGVAGSGFQRPLDQRQPTAHPP